MGLFNKIFGGGKEEQFQRAVLKVAESLPGSASIRPGKEPLTVLMNDAELDLTDLHKRCILNEVQSEELIRQYFSFPLAFLRNKPASWHDAQLKVRPQIVPAEMAQRFGLVLLTFADALGIAIIIKEADDQYFVRSTDLNAWNIQPEEVLNTAVLNLNNDPVEMEVTVTDGSDRFIGLETRDGLDAARILTPKLRDLAVSKLGEKYYAGLPNRDFLILWALDSSQRFQDYAIEKIQTDFEIQPYPLSARRFEITNDSISLLSD